MLCRPSKRRITLVLVSFACFLCAATGANTTTYDLGPSSGGTESFSAGSLGSKFTDDYRFFLTTLSDIFATVSAVGLKNLSMNLFSETTVGKKNKVKDVFIASGTTLSFADLAAGQYFLEINGQPVNKQILGSYSGSLTVAAVPEPEVWAMMLAGLGLIGYRLWRKSADGELRIAAV
jgi:PEP-CTERM motif